MIRLEHVSLNLQKKQILQDVSLEVGPGEIVGLIGYNGSGKTMLMKCICGFHVLYEGNIFIKEKNIRDVPEFSNDIGLIIETPGFIPYFSGLKNLKALADLNHKIGTAEIKKSMASVGLNPDSKLAVRKYSLGMRQRLGIAQALMEDPAILVLDEPMNGLDYEMAKKVRKTLLAEKERDKAILITSHNPYDIEFLCDRVYQISKGCITEGVDADMDRITEEHSE